MDELKRKLKESKNYLNSYIKTNPEFAVIFGTGLAEETLKYLGNSIKIFYGDVPHLNPTSIDSHDGKMIFTEINNKDILLMSGRIHYYEGYSIQDVVYPIHILKEMGIKDLLITSAVGNVNENFKRGDLMIVEDHINLTSINPLIGYDDSLGERFLSCTDLYNKELIRTIEDICKEKSIDIKKGNMYFLPGPTFETRAEFNAIKNLGADTIGWSNVPEAIVAHYRKIKVASIVCITDSLNYENKVSLNKIIEIANESSKLLFNIIEGLISYYNHSKI